MLGCFASHEILKRARHLRRFGAVFPFNFIVIIDAEAWLMAQPCPLNFICSVQAAMHIRVVTFVIETQRLDHRTRLLRRRRVVKINQRVLAPAGPGSENLPAPRSNQSARWKHDAQLKCAARSAARHFIYALLASDGCSPFFGGNIDNL